MTSPTDPRQAESRRRVLELYREVDAEVARAGPVCVASGKCCRFAEYGHTLFLSAVEADVLLAGAPPFSGPVGPEACPFQVNTLCTAREPRPLGCRIYHCDPAFQETGRDITERALARLKILSDELGLDWRYAPLHTFLKEAIPPAAPASPPTPPTAPNCGPLSLPVIDVTSRGSDA